MKQIIKYVEQWLLSLFHRHPVTRKKQQNATSTDKKRIARGVKAFFDRRYELRYNVIKQQEEFRPRHQDDADQENSDHQNLISDHQNFSNQHQNSAAEHQHDGWL